jgi:hypothetical protein
VGSGNLEICIPFWYLIFLVRPLFLPPSLSDLLILPCFHFIFWECIKSVLGCGLALDVFLFFLLLSSCSFNDSPISSPQAYYYDECPSTKLRRPMLLVHNDFY